MKYLFGACIVSATLVAAPALADQGDFTGPSVTAIAGVDHNRQGDNRAGALYGGQIGYDVQTGGLVIGAEAELNGSSSDGCKTRQATSPASTNRYCNKALREIVVGGRIGAVAGETTLIYGKVGYANARTRFDNSFSATPALNFAGRGNSSGVKLGAGIEKRLGEAVSLKAEYRYTNYEGLYSRHQGVVGVGFHF